jgi:hypothetical protein
MSGGISGSSVVSEENKMLKNLYSSHSFSEMNSLCHILQFALYIPISARSISGTERAGIARRLPRAHRPAPGALPAARAAHGAITAKRIAYQIRATLSVTGRPADILTGQHGNRISATAPHRCGGRDLSSIGRRQLADGQTVPAAGVLLMPARV